MPITVKPKFISVIADDPVAQAAGEVTPSRWNDGHEIEMATGVIIGRATAGTGDAEELTPAQARALLDVPATGDVTSGVIFGKLITADMFGNHQLHSYPGATPAVTPFHALGHKWVRTLNGGFNHREVETAKGVFNWTRADAWMAQAAANNFYVLVTGGNPPAWATGGTVVTIGGNGAYNMKPYDNLADQADWITALYNRYNALYPGMIRAWEAQNETNASYWVGTTAQVVAQTENAFDTWAALDPDVEVLSPNVTNDSSARYMAQLFDLGLGDFIHGVSFHSYTETPEQIPWMVRQMRAVTDRYGYPDMPIWNTEFSSLSYYVGYDRLTAGPNLMPAKRAAGHVMRNTVLSVIHGSHVSFHYAVDGYQEPFMLIDETDETALSPAGEAYAFILDLMIGSKVVDYVVRDDGAHFVMFLKGTTYTLMAWAAEGTHPTIEPGTMGASTITALDSGGGLVEDDDFEAVYQLSEPIFFTVAEGGVNATQSIAANQSTARWPITGNREFKLRSSATVINDWGTGGAATIADLTPSANFPFGGVRVNPNAQFGSFRQSLSRGMEPGWYEAVIRYETLGKGWMFYLDGLTGAAVMRPDLNNAFIPPMPSKGEFRFPFWVPYFFDSGWRFRVQFQNASGFEYIDIEEMVIEKLGSPPVQLEPYTQKIERLASSSLLEGNFNANDIIEYTTAALTQSKGAPKELVTVSGSLGSLVGVTADISTLSTTVSNVNPPDSLKRGQFVQFNGGTKRQVVSKTNSTTYVLDANAGATVVGAAVTVAAPTLTKLGYAPRSDGALELPNPYIVGVNDTAFGAYMGIKSGSTFIKRFGLELNNEPVTGVGNAGQNIELWSYNDGGAKLALLAKWARASGFFEHLSSAFKILGAWNAPFIMGYLRLWQNAATGRLMAKTSAPASDVDGVEVALEDNHVTFLTISGTTITASLDVKITGAAATHRNLTFQTAGVDRIKFEADNSAEGGANAGSNAALSRYDDAGVFLGVNWEVRRSNGQWLMHDLFASPSYANDAAAAAGGVPLAGVYRNGSVIQIRMV